VTTRSCNLSLFLVRRFHSAPPKYFLKIHLNIKIPSTPTPYKWSLSLRFPHQNLVRISSLPRNAHFILPVLRIPVIPVQHHPVDTTHTACSACDGCFISTEFNSPDLNSTTHNLGIQHTVVLPTLNKRKHCTIKKALLVTKFC